LDAVGIQAGREITEVKAKMPITSVNWMQPAFKQGEKLPK
jgi:hypothetical protein